MIKNGKRINPFLYSIVVFAITMLLPWGVAYRLFCLLPGYYGGALKYGVSLVLGVICVYATEGKLNFSIQNEKFMKGLFSYGLLGLICAIAAAIFSYSSIEHGTTIGIMVGYILYNLMIALSEEVIFRGVILHKFLDKGTNIFRAIIASSTIFGLRHFINLITMPNTMVSTIGQVGFTFMAGFYLCAVYLKTKNIWICVLIHFLEDFSTGLWSVFSDEALAATQNQDGSIMQVILLVAVHSIYVIFGVLMLKSKEGEKE